MTALGRSPDKYSGRMSTHANRLSKSTGVSKSRVEASTSNRLGDSIEPGRNGRRGAVPFVLSCHSIRDRAFAAAPFVSVGQPKFTMPMGEERAKRRVRVQRDLSPTTRSSMHRAVVNREPGATNHPFFPLPEHLVAPVRRSEGSLTAHARTRARARGEEMCDRDTCVTGVSRVGAASRRTRHGDAVGGHVTVLLGWRGLEGMLRGGSGSRANGSHRHPSSRWKHSGIKDVVEMACRTLLFLSVYWYGELRADRGKRRVRKGLECLTSENYPN